MQNNCFCSLNLLFFGVLVAKAPQLSVDMHHQLSPPIKAPTKKAITRRDVMMPIGYDTVVGQAPNVQQCTWIALLAMMAETTTASPHLIAKEKK